MRALFALVITTTSVLAGPTETALTIAPDQVECIQETVWHDWGSEPEEVKQFYFDAHIAGLLAAYAGVSAGIYDRETIETAYGWFGCDWIQTLDLAQRATIFPEVMTQNPRHGLVQLPFLQR